ncbi:MAG: HD domain-containing protein [Bacteroidales bacterium]|nr:HD domain-containing protein [Bacteroidales bacterium]
MTLHEYIEAEIIPRYGHFDDAHKTDHVRTVIEQSLMLADKVDARGEGEPLNRDMVYAIAAYHDTGLCEGRKTHHLVSGRIIRSDEKLRLWFTPEQIEIMARAAEDHRASSDHEPRSIYGRIVAEADRIIDAQTIVRRTIQYGLSHYPELDREGHWQRMCEHLKEKYDYGGYLKLWIEESPNAARLEEFRQNLKRPGWLRSVFDSYFPE